MGKALVALCAGLVVMTLSTTAMADPVIVAHEIASGMVSPVAIVSPPDGSHRLFIVDQVGLIRVVDANGNLLSEPFLDIRDKVIPLMPGYDERGLLGLAFHPDYVHNGRFFVKYSAPLRVGAVDNWDHTNVVAEFAVSAADPNRADPNSEKRVLAIDHPQFNHNSGWLAFGPDDGYLYFAEGDGGNANDVGKGHVPQIGNAQDIVNLLGSIFRIDVNPRDMAPYNIPPDNPFTGRNQRGAPEIWAYGVRNPYSFAFDMGGNHDLIGGDEGQNAFEGVDVIRRGGNYGWNLREGMHCFNPQSPDTVPPSCADVGYFGEPLINPVVEYPNSSDFPQTGLGHAVVGGRVYRGTLMPQYYGKYIFGDFTLDFTPNGSLFVATPSDDGQSPWGFEQFTVEREGSTLPGRLGLFLKGFGQDDQGEVYIAATDSLGPNGTSGAIFRLESSPAKRTPGVLSLAWSGEVGAPGSVRFQLDQPGHVSLRVFDVSGRVVRSLIDADLPAGSRDVAWDGRDEKGATVPSGVYFYRMSSNRTDSGTRILILH